MKKTIHVVGAIIENTNKEILCALRSPKMSLANHWEFPGGKIEPGEDYKQAIEREIKEELDCIIQANEVFCDTTHDYGTFIVHLVCLKCILVNGTPIPKEHASLLWLKRESLSSLRWAPADILTVEKLMEDM